MKRSARSGVSSAGFRTTVLPQTSAGRELPGGDRDREVPRRDRADDADGHPHRHLELVAQLGGRRLAEEAAALAGHVDRHVDRLLDVAAGLREHLAHLAAHQLGQLVLLLLEQAREAEEDVAALRRRHEPPLLERGLRRLDGAVDVRRGSSAGSCRASRRSPAPATRTCRRRLRRSTCRRRSSCTASLRPPSGRSVVRDG